MDEITPTIHVLLADDDEDFQFLFRDILNELSVSVILQTVEDGKKLMGKLALIKNPPPPHVIFLDINMPIKDGITCLKEIRSHSNFDHIPVFMFSTSDVKKDIEDAFFSGANLYIPKEVFFTADKEIIEKLFSVSYSEYLNKRQRQNFVLNKKNSK